MALKTGVLLLAAAVGLSSGSAQGREREAIDGCVDKIREVGGPDGANGAQILSSEYSEAGTLVMLRDAGGTVWRCLAANNGVVEDLNVAEAADDGDGAMDRADSDAQRAVVRFPAGTSETSLNGSVTGHGYFDYVLGARAGQTLHASIKVTRTDGDGTIYFNVLPPGSDGTAIFNGSMSSDGTGKVVLPSSGDYIVRVYLMGNDEDAGKTVSYRLDVSVK